MASTDELLTHWLKGDAHAIALCSTLLTVLHCWDDLIDKDVPVSDEHLNAVMWAALVELPENPFYHRHFHTLHPIIKTGILNWHSANRLEASTEKAHHIFAFVIRAVVTDVIAMCALIIGGVNWGRSVHYDMQVQNEESFDEYEQTIAAAQKEVR